MVLADNSQPRREAMGGIEYKLKLFLSGTPEDLKALVSVTGGRHPAPRRGARLMADERIREANQLRADRGDTVGVFRLRADNCQPKSRAIYQQKGFNTRFWFEGGSNKMARWRIDWQVRRPWSLPTDSAAKNVTAVARQKHPEL